MKKVLVVDDDPTVVALLKAKLEKTERFLVIGATEGEEAVRLAESEKPDVVLCDIDMPDMDGISVAQALEKKDATRKIPVLFLSSLVTPNDVKRGVQAGGKPMLSKQSPLKELVERIESAGRR